MGRTQAFESAAVVRSARDAFWERGYEGTSVVDLERATGLNRSSLYHAFGSKRGLFDAAVADYLESVVRPRLRALATGAPTVEALQAYFGGLGAAIETLPGSSPPYGCLLVNCAAGLAGHDDAARRVVDGYRAELAAALRRGLAAATTDAVVTPAELDARTRVLESLSMGAMLLARVSPGEAVALLATARDHIASWCGRAVPSA